MPILCLYILLVLALESNVSALNRLYYAISNQIIYDSNLPQNTTEYAGWYNEPAVYLKYKPPCLQDHLSLWTRLRYGHYVQERSPTLNNPFSSYGADYTMDFKVVRYVSGISISSYLHPDWQIARNKFEWSESVAITRDRNEWTIDLNLMANDYGDNLYDGIRMEDQIIYTHSTKNTRKKKPIFKSISFALQNESNFTKTGNTSYNIFGFKNASLWKLGKISLEPSISVENKKYTGSLLNLNTYQTVQPENKYLNLGADITYNLTSQLELSLNGQWRLKNSNYPTYDYNRNTIALGLRWTGMALSTEAKSP